jgi:hypothetical protein
VTLPLSVVGLTMMANKTVITVGILAPFLESPGPTKVRPGNALLGRSFVTAPTGGLFRLGGSLANLGPGAATWAKVSESWGQRWTAGNKVT